MLKKGNLLIVDDNPALLSQVSEDLAASADQIFTAQSGAEALHLLQRESIQCVVCDYEMPEMNGLEVLRELRALGNPTPFIFYTGNQSKGLIVEAARQGAYGLLLKPDGNNLKRLTQSALKLGLSQWITNPTCEV